MRRTSGCTMIGSAFSRRLLRAGQRAALAPVARIDRGVLVGDLGEREPLHADAEPRLVHHREHGAKPLFRLADQPAGRAVVVHDAGGVAVDAHLLFDRAAGDGVPRAGVAGRVGQEFRHDEERYALCRPPARLRCARAPGARCSSVRSCSPAEMKIFWPVMLVAAVAGGDRLRLDQPEIGAALRLRQVHRARPFARDEFWQIERLLLLRAVQRRARRSRPAISPGYMPNDMLAEVVNSLTIAAST